MDGAALVAWIFTAGGGFYLFGTCRRGKNSGVRRARRATLSARPRRTCGDHGGPRRCGGSAGDVMSDQYRSHRWAAVRRAFVVGTVAAVALVGAACGGEDDDGGATREPVGTASESSATGTEPTSADATVQVADTKLGSVLVDADGLTLYLFTNDSEGQSTCEDACADLWPPLLVDDGEPSAGDPADAELIGTADRADGSTQVTYAGHPLYRYAPDQAPGDVTGHGVNDVWFAVAADGSPVETSPAAAGPGY